MCDINVVPLPEHHIFYGGGYTCLHFLIISTDFLASCHID